MKKIINLTILCCSAFVYGRIPSFLEAPSPWADATIATMTFEEKIAQCFMPVVPVDLNEEEIQQAEAFIKKYKVGGVFLGGPGTIEQQVALVNRLQVVSKVPLLIGQDLEYGPAMRLTNGMQWPFAITLGAVTNDTLVYQVAAVMGAQARGLGVHVSASPVADINSNPKNPIINIRSFGSTRETVIPKVLATIKGLEDGGVLSCIKHFPGHGDTHQDSHKVLPVLKHNQQRLFDVELAPFQSAIDEGVSVVMTGHLSVPALDQSGMPATLSSILIRDLLQHTMRFQGLVMTDALTMKALPSAIPVEINLRALDAGNDLLIYADQIPETIQHIKDLMINDKTSQENRQKIEAMFTERAHKILKAKEWLGLSCKKLIDPVLATVEATGTQEMHELAETVYEYAMTVVRDEKQIIPLKNLKDKKVLVITQGGAQPFLNQFLQNTKSDHITDKELNTSHKNFADYDTIVYVYVPPVDMLAGLSARMFFSREFEPGVLDRLEYIYGANKNLVIVLCASPFLLYELPTKFPVLVAYETNDKAQKAAADALSGKNPIRGKLPLILPDPVVPKKVSHEKDL